MRPSPGGEEGAEMVGVLILCCALLGTLDVRVHDGTLRIALAGSPARPARTP